MAYDWSTDELGIGRRLADRATAQASGSAGTFPGTGIPREMLAKLIGAKALGEQPATDEPPTIEMPAEDVPRDVPIEMPAEDVRRASGVSVVPEQRPPVVINVNAAPPAGAPVASGVTPAQAPQVQPQAGSPAPSDAPAPSGATPDPYSMAADMYGLAAGQGAAAGMDAGALNELEAGIIADETERARREIDPLLEQRMRAEKAYQEDLLRQRERISSAVEAVSQTANPFSGPAGSDRIMAFAFAGIASEQFGVGRTLINIMEADASGRHAAAKERLAGLSDELAATMNVSKEVAASLDAQVALRESQVIRRLQSVHAQLEPGRQKLATEAAIAELYKDYGDRVLKIQKAQLEDEKTRAEIGKLESESRKNDALARKAGRGGGGGGGVGMLQPGMYASLYDIPAKRRSSAVQLPDGSGRWVVLDSSDSKKKADETLIKNQMLIDMADEYLGNLANDIPDFAGKLVNKAWTAADVAVIEAHNEQFKLKLARAFDQGAISDGDRTSYEKIIPSPKTLDAHGVDAIRNLRSNTARDSATVLNRYLDRKYWMTGDDIHGGGPQPPKEVSTKTALGRDYEAPKDRSGDVTTDAQGNPLIGDEEEQRQTVEAFVEAAKEEYLGDDWDEQTKSSMNITHEIKLKKFRKELIEGKGGRKDTEAEIAALDKRINQLAKKKDRDSQRKLEANRRARSRLVARRDALNKHIDRSYSKDPIF